MDTMANPSWKRKILYCSKEWSMVNNRRNNCQNATRNWACLVDTVSQVFLIVCDSEPKQHTSKVKPKSRKIKWKHWICIKPARTLVAKWEHQSKGKDRKISKLSVLYPVNRAKCLLHARLFDAEERSSAGDTMASKDVGFGYCTRRGRAMHKDSLFVWQVHEILESWDIHHELHAENSSNWSL